MAVAAQTGRTVDLAQTAALHAAEGGLRQSVGQGHVVDAGAAGLHARGQLDAALGVPGPHVAVEPVVGIVGHAQGLLLIADLHDGDNGPERLLRHQLHVVADVGDDRGLVVEALQVRVATTSDPDCGALLPGVLHVALDDRELLVPEDRPHVVLAGVALAQLAGAGDHLLDEVVVHVLDHVDPFGAAAVMPGVHAGADQRSLNGTIDVGVLANDHGVLAAELEGEGDQLLGAGHGDPAPGGDAPRERHLVDAAVHQGGPGLAVALEHLVQVRRKAREELQAIEKGRYGNQPLPEPDVRLICIGKCLELYSTHYGHVLDRESVATSSQSSPGYLHDY